MGIGHTHAVLAAFAVAAVLVLYWRVVLTLLAIGFLGLLLVGVTEVAHWIQALS